MTANIDWSKLGFEYLQTACHLTAEYHDGKWGELVSQEQPMMPLHIAAQCLHYGQACFEGLKAFTQPDGSVGIFRPEENSRRMARSAERLVMAPVPEPMFLEACRKLIELNREFVPPRGYKASFYIRPVLLGTTPVIGVKGAKDFLFLAIGMPMGSYYREGFKPVKAMIHCKYDRAAPLGVGSAKVAGNYAAGLLADAHAKKAGFPVSLYLDSQHHRYIDEFATSNFIAITRDGKFVTPDSATILPSITNKSLQQLAVDMGLTVERRRVDVAELSEFAEVGACGTAVVVTPVESIRHGDQ
ncbi:MAG: branched chain amino acid aminotransferase, partial [Deltaproteobacteria bacterium RIFOXYB12_FULL_58_9]